MKRKVNNHIVFLLIFLSTLSCSFSENTLIEESQECENCQIIGKWEWRVISKLQIEFKDVLDTIPKIESPTVVVFEDTGFGYSLINGERNNFKYLFKNDSIMLLGESVFLFEQKNDSLIKLSTLSSSILPPSYELIKIR